SGRTVSGASQRGRPTSSGWWRTSPVGGPITSSTAAPSQSAADSASTRPGGESCGNESGDPGSKDRRLKGRAGSDRQRVLRDAFGFTGRPDSTIRRDSPRRNRGHSLVCAAGGSREAATDKETFMGFRPAGMHTLATAICAAALAACGGGSDSPQPLNCADITTANLGLSGLKVAQAVEVAASGALPAHCKVTGSINDRTGID